MIELVRAKGCLLGLAVGDAVGTTILTLLQQMLNSMGYGKWLILLKIWVKKKQD